MTNVGLENSIEQGGSHIGETQFLLYEFGGFVHSAKRTYPEKEEMRKKKSKTEVISIYSLSTYTLDWFLRFI